MIRALALLAMIGVATLTIGLLAGCESTQDKSARLARQAKREIGHQQGLEVGPRSRTVTVLSRRIVQDPNGVAVVVRLRNRGPDQAKVPIAITVRDHKGRALYRNDTPGLDPSLTSQPLIERRRTATWINNQITVSGRAHAVSVRVGEGRRLRPGPRPRIVLSKIRKGGDISGAYIKGVVANRSRVLQRRLTISCVAGAAGGRIAAGRAVIEKLAPAAGEKKPTRFTAYFIGRPTGAVRCSAPPVQLPGGSA